MCLLAVISKINRCTDNVVLLPVAVRNQVATLKHTIRHQQAQLITLENTLRTQPRPLHDFSDPMLATSYPPSSYDPGAPSTSKMKKRSSFDILHGIAGPDSNLPLPRRDAASLEENGIQEGIPMSFGVGPVSPTSYKRGPSPTRTLSRMSLCLLVDCAWC